MPTLIRFINFHTNQLIIKINSPNAAWRLAGWRQTLKPFKRFTITWLRTIPGFRCRTSTSTRGIFTSNLSPRRTGADTWWGCARLEASLSSILKIPLSVSNQHRSHEESGERHSKSTDRQEKVFKCWQVIDKNVRPEVLPPRVHV